MVIKIRCDEKWVVYDNFVNVSFEQIRRDAPYPDIDNKWCGTKSNTDYGILIVGKRWDDTEISIVANQDVYLLNDEGKTIEKIN